MPHLALVACLLLALAGCTCSGEPDPAERLHGTWEVAAEVGPVTRNGQRYTFGEDGTLRIRRRAGLGPASTIEATYTLLGDTTLVIESPFGAERMTPSFRGDTLHLAPREGGAPLLLLRTAPLAPTTSPPAP